MSGAKDESDPVKMCNKCGTPEEILYSVCISWARDIKEKPGEFTTKSGCTSFDDICVHCVDRAIACMRR